MQRRFVLQGSAPRPHPIRPHVRRVSAQVRKTQDDSDLKLFAMSFAAFFVCFYTFIL